MDTLHNSLFIIYACLFVHMSTVSVSPKIHLHLPVSGLMPSCFITNSLSFCVSWAVHGVVRCHEAGSGLGQALAGGCALLCSAVLFCSVLADFDFSISVAW
jgi:hypothetical protein